MQFDREDYLKVNRKLSREEEIKTHGRPVRIGGRKAVGSGKGDQGVAVEALIHDGLRLRGESFVHAASPVL